MEKSKHENLLFETLHDIAPVPPDLWKRFLEIVEIKSYIKGRILQANLLDLYIVLEGIIIKRENTTKQVIDFICKKQFIFHNEEVDDCYFIVDKDAVVAFISNDNLLKLSNEFPKFKDHMKHFGADVLKRSTLRGRFIVLLAREKKMKLLELYPEVYINCSSADKSSFLGMTPNYYSSIII
jgi:signal-transduction protein with cAMP-binding, CBS, and nucleotidyltransferase domain